MANSFTVHRGGAWWVGTALLDTVQVFNTAIDADIPAATQTLIWDSITASVEDVASGIVLEFDVRDAGSGRSLFHGTVGSGSPVDKHFPQGFDSRVKSRGFDINVIAIAGAPTDEHAAITLVYQPVFPGNPPVV